MTNFSQTGNSQRAGGVTGFARWVYRWLYWNAGLRHLVVPLGLGFRKYGIQDPIVVYQPGKVGSTSLYVSLKRLELDVPLYHLHFLDDLDAMQEVIEKTADAQAGLRDIARARQIRQAMARAPQKKWNFITLTRMPISRLVSVFFQALDNYFPNAAERYAAQTLKLDEVIRFFVDEFREAWAEQWFDRQLKTPFGLDVYATPFDKARGYQIYAHDNLCLLIVRLEDLNRVAPEALREFLGIPNFLIVNRNVGENKPTGTLYRDFIAALRLPPGRIEELHGTNYARQFYTPQELEASVARWV